MLSFVVMELERRERMKENVRNDMHLNYKLKTGENIISPCGHILLHKMEG